MLKRILSLFCFFLFQVTAQAEINDIGGTFTQDYRFYFQPGFEYDFAFSDLGSTAGLKTSPRVFTRFKIERDRMYFSPDAGLGVMTGLGGANPIFFTGGFIAGYRAPPPTVGFYGGVSCDSFFGSGSATGVIFRFGFDMDYQMSGAQFFSELRAGAFFQSPGGISTTYSYFGVHSGVQFLIGN